MPSRRLFIAIPLNDELRKAIGDYRLAASAVEGLRWIAEENLHVTIVFLGDIENDKMSELKSEIGRIVKKHSPFVLRMAKISASPHRKPMVWAEFAQNESYVDLVIEMRKAMSAFTKVDDRDPRAHISVARPGKPPASKHDIPNQEFDGPDLQVDWLELWESQLSQEGAEYSSLGKFKLN